MRDVCIKILEKSFLGEKNKNKTLLCILWCIIVQPPQMTNLISHSLRETNFKEIGNKYIKYFKNWVICILSQIQNWLYKNFNVPNEIIKSKQDPL